jgi:aldehyde oxidoreductase
MANVTLTVNGVKRKIAASPDLVLIDLLREQLTLTGTKQSCDRKGQCGACTVVVDGKAVRSCLKKVADMDGANVITVEGLGTPKNPHLIQEAFVLAGAVQCGFCTPGMIMAAKALLDTNPNPDTEAIKKALARNLCRCTGYVKIIEAVKLAGKFLRKETTPEKIKATINKKKAIGQNHPRPSAYIKACGVAKFGADYKLDNPLEISPVLSTEFHAIIKKIDSSTAAKMPGVVGIMTADDIKGTNRLRVIVPDQPVLCEDKVRAFGDPIAIVAADTAVHARAAAAEVQVTYEKLKVMKTPEEALAPDAVQIHPNSPNLCYQQPQVKGDAEKAFKDAAFTVEHDFSTQMNHQAALEPETCVCYFEGNTLVVVGRSINIHAHAGIIKEAVGAENIRYIEPFSGGQFGIKASISSEGIAAAAAMHWKRPIRYIPTLEESFLVTSKRHPFFMKAKLAADAKGNITAYFNDFIMNKGAYFLLGTIIPGRALHMLNGAYNIPNIKASVKLVYTNNGSGGAARGAGPPQVMFALESLVDMLAEKMKMDPLELRKKNVLKVGQGQTRSTGSPIDQTDMVDLIGDIKPHYERAKKDAAAFNKQGGKIKRGVGIACMSFGIAEAGDRADNAIEINPDDTVTVYAAIADPGEGNDSMLSQLAAQVLGLSMDKIRLYTRDTNKTVAAGPSAGSRQTYMGGGAMVNAAEQLVKAMKEAGGKTYVALKKAGKATRYEGVKIIPGKKEFDIYGQSPSFDSQVHNIQMAEVEVNTETGTVKVLKMTTAVDAGVVIHPQNLEGQLEGGMDQGIGYALREEFILGTTKDWLTFKFPTINDSVEVEFIKREIPRKRGTLGSTGIGEMTMVSTAPAVTNAIYNACGARVYSLPATPEKVKATLSVKK